MAPCYPTTQLNPQQEKAKPEGEGPKARARQSFSSRSWPEGEGPEAKPEGEGPTAKPEGEGPKARA